MSGRCRSCDSVLTDDEMVAKWPGTISYIDMCFVCLSKSEIEEPDQMNLDLISVEEFPETLE